MGSGLSYDGFRLSVVRGGARGHIRGSCDCLSRHACERPPGVSRAVYAVVTVDPKDRREAETTPAGESACHRSVFYHAVTDGGALIFRNVMTLERVASGGDTARRRRRCASRGCARFARGGSPRSRRRRGASAADERTHSREGREARGGPQGGGADPAARSTVDGAEQRGTYEVSHPTGARADTLDEDPGAVSNLKTPRARP